MNATQDTTIKKGIIRWLARETLGNIVVIGILFGITGRWDWWMGWALSGMYILLTALSAIFILPVNPSMLVERAQPHTDKRKWDTTLVGIMGILMLFEYALASLDVRMGWTPQLPFAIQIFGLVAAVVSYDFLIVWAMVSNTFFVTTVRIQTDRQHSVISNGPYRYIRHPGYLGILLMHLSVPLMLNSLWAFIPAFLIAVILVARTTLEDKTLHTELPGYEDYAERVRYRLLPGLW
jgi:protein-S-isoprenylcysteine O-methyltransferase Ste14